MLDYPGDNWHPAKDLFLAEITAVGTAVTDSSGRFVPHAWKEKELRTDTRGFVDKPGGRTGTTVIHPGFDPTGGTFAVGDLVFMRERGWINASGVSGDVYDIVCAAGVRGDECCPGYLGDTGHESCCDFLGKPGGDCCDCDCDGGGGGGGGNTCPGPQNGGMGCPVAPGSELCFGTCTDQGFQQWALGPDCVPRNVMTGAPVNTLPEESCRGPLPGPVGGGGGPPPSYCPPGWTVSPGGYGCCDKPWMWSGNQWICPSDTVVMVGGGVGEPPPIMPRSAVFGRGSLGRDALGGSVLDDAGVTTSPPAAVGLPTNTVTPADLTVDVNDYAPGSGMIFRLSTDDLGAVNITGLSIGQVSGQQIILLNVGTIDNIVLKVENASSSAANRFLGADSTSIADITLTPNNGTRFFYDGGASRWRNL